MYYKKLREYFKKMVIRQADLANAFGDIDNFKWICLYYLDGMNDALYVTYQYHHCVPTFSSESFEYIFRSIVEYRKGVC